MHIVGYLIENEADISIQERIGVSICDSGTNKNIASYSFPGTHKGSLSYGSII